MLPLVADPGTQAEIAVLSISLASKPLLRETQLTVTVWQVEEWELPWFVCF